MSDPRLAFAESVVSSGKEDLNGRCGWKRIAQDRILFENCLLLRSRFLVVQVPTDLKFQQIVIASRIVDEEVVAVVALVLLRPFNRRQVSKRLIIYRTGLLTPTLIAFQQVRDKADLLR